MKPFEDFLDLAAAYSLESMPNCSSLDLISTLYSRPSNLLFGNTRQKFPIVLFLSVLLASCAGEGIQHRAQDQLLSSIEKGTAPVIVDVRSQSEYESGHVPGALHLPFYAMWSRHSEINGKPEDPVILYCEHEPRAWIAKFALWTLGYTNLVYLDGHMAAWKEQGLPLAKSEEPYE